MAHLKFFFPENMVIKLLYTIQPKILTRSVKFKSLIHVTNKDKIIVSGKWHYFVLQVCFIASKRSMTIKSNKIWFPPKVFFYLKKRSKRKKWQECRVFSSKGIIDICKGSGKMEGQFSKFDMKELIIHQKVTSIAGLVKMWLIVHSQKKKRKKEKNVTFYWVSVEKK